VIFVAQGNEAERLITRALKLARRVQHFGHAVDRARLSVECDFDEISGGEFMLQLQQSAGHGDGLEFCACPLAAVGHHCGRNRSMELYTGRTLVDIGLGEVGHRRIKLCHVPAF
jgi:hypothetical protein